ncbi:sensor histidine kinase [Dictyobacter kobayashii]|uniref:histidine kinase n=1 Tax=Dictyobacter kobayashii TaxID=2014872 RepID=A0A402AUR8_9CHLR|nr:HAMP domain-containing sensor histidine kinase [Dictyobacter kobayashii]GCE22870.1 hypothetical protein KDK_66700 [Dictyobacter kobayashii]
MEAQNQPTMDMLTTLSHELRTPLTAIKGYTATLVRHEQHLKKQERLEFLHAIQQASERLETIINQLIEVQQLELKPLTLEYGRVKLCELISEVIEDGKNAAQQLLQYIHHIHPERSLPSFQFTMSCDSEESKIETVTICADRQRLKEVLKNLIENALLYSPYGGAIEIGVRMLVNEEIPSVPQQPAEYQLITCLQKTDNPALHNQQMIEIWIQDHGIGIEPDQLKEIFNGFHRVDTRLTREVNGLGLGLTISKRIIELHHGTIWAESEPGKGSTFHILLPAA